MPGFPVHHQLPELSSALFWSPGLCLLTIILIGSFPGVSSVKNLPAVQEPQETWVQSLYREDPLEEGMATHSSILAWRIPWTEEPRGLQSIGLQNRTRLK